MPGHQQHAIESIELTAPTRPSRPVLLAVVGLQRSSHPAPLLTSIRHSSVHSLVPVSALDCFTAPWRLEGRSLAASTGRTAAQATRRSLRPPQPLPSAALRSRGEGGGAAIRDAGSSRSNLKEGTAGAIRTDSTGVQGRPSDGSGGRSFRFRCRRCSPRRSLLGPLLLTASAHNSRTSISLDHMCA